MKIRVFAPPFSRSDRVDEDGMVELPEGSTLDDLMRVLGLPFRGAMARFCSVNHEHATRNRILEDGDTVSFLSIVSGG